MPSELARSFGRVYSTIVLVVNGDKGDLLFTYTGTIFKTPVKPFLFDNQDATTNTRGLKNIEPYADAGRIATGVPL